MFYFPGCASRPKCRDVLQCKTGFPIRKSPDQRLLGTSPKLIAAKLRPSSPFRAKASTIRPYINRFIQKISFEIFWFFILLYEINLSTQILRSKNCLGLFPHNNLVPYEVDHVYMIVSSCGIDAKIYNQFLQSFFLISNYKRPSSQINCDEYLIVKELFLYCPRQSGDHLTKFRAI